MIKQRSQILVAWFKTWDLLWTGISWILAYHIRFDTGLIPIKNEVPDISLCYGNLLQVLLVAFVAYRMTGQYEITRFRRLREEMASVLRGVGLMGLLVIAVIFGMHSPYESRTTMVVFMVLAFFTISFWRRSTWWAIQELRHLGYNQTFSIIVGSGRVARKTARGLRHAAWMGIKNIGFVEDQPSRWADDLDILGTVDDLPKLIEKYRISHVFIALPMNRYHEARKVFDVLSQTLAEVRLVADVPEMAALSLTTTNLDGLPIVGLRESPHFGLNIFVKRAMDIALAAIGLVLLSPILALLAILVKLTSPGPIFYRQERCGLNGKPFMMLKFRSMRVDAEQQSGAVWTVKDDPRRTRFGTFIRKTSLDELPQLINVLKGDMSLVGPRPERPVFIQKFQKTIPNYTARHAVKAGITGWAQVNGWRGNTSLRKRIQYDLYYITHWTPWLDVKIMWMTVWQGLIHRNAY
jgi:Undecaprenyl-phosphate glucose phosphotransferase